MGHEASDFNRELVEGKRVRLEYDVERLDRYGRTLAYVYLDTLFVNAELVRLGYAQIMTIPPNVRYAERFRRLQAEAREKNRGLWDEGAEKAWHSGKN
jgi:micrococcal nuclease